MSPLLPSNFGQGAILRKSSHCSSLQDTHTLNCWSGGKILEVLQLQSFAAEILILVTKEDAIFRLSFHYSTCSPFLHRNFCRVGDSSKVFPSKHSPHVHRKFLNFSNCNPLQATLTLRVWPGAYASEFLAVQPMAAHTTSQSWSWVPQKSSHCSSLLVTFKSQLWGWGNNSEVFVSQSMLAVLTLQFWSEYSLKPPNAAHCWPL